MLKKSLTEDAQEVFRAIALIELGARMQVLESELTLSRDRMIRLYREVKGVSPPKGMLPFSADWYMTWLANIHASLFYNTYVFLKKEAGCSHLDALTKGYRLYLEHCKNSDVEAVLDLTRAWTLVRFFDAGMLQLTKCCRCTGKFIAHKHDLQENVVCGACQPPSRAGKTKKAAAARQASQETALVELSMAMTNEVPEPTVLDRLRKFLQPEIEQGLVEVTGTVGQPLVRITGRGMFPSGSASVNASFKPLLDRIGLALKEEPGTVRVIGYTDDQPIRTIAFPSNFQLSTARAKEASALIGASVGDASRLTAEGRADADPIATNATPEGRERNRRIEVVLNRQGA